MLIWSKEICTKQGKQIASRLLTAMLRYLRMGGLTMSVYHHVDCLHRNLDALETHIY